MNKMIKTLLFIVFLGILTSCEDDGEIVQPQGSGEGLVIQSLMTDKPGRQEVNISRLMLSLTDTLTAVRGAKVFLTSDDSVIVFREDTLRPGVYYNSQSLQMLKKYTLQVIYNQQVYTATTSGEPGMLFNPPVFQINEKDSLWYPVFVAPPFMPDHPALYELTADWSMLPGFEGTPAEKCRARMLFFTLPSIDVTQLLPPPSLNKGFPKGTIVTVRRYAMDMSYAAYWREVLLETRWAAGLFALESANVPTNFTGGARGWFAICGVTEVSMVIGE